VRSYYDAIDFKEFEKTYSFINPESKLSVSQFMLQTSVQMESWIPMQTGCQSENNSTIWKWGNPIGQDKMDHPLEIIKSTDTKSLKLMENGLNLKK
jgi:hypothetical protein